MMLVISYDVNTTGAAGEKRLRKVASVKHMVAVCKIQYSRFWLIQLNWLH